MRHELDIKQVAKDSPMKIAYVIGGLPFGGVESWLLDLALCIKKNTPHQCKIFNVSGTGVKMQEYLHNEIEVQCVGNSNNSAAMHRLDTLWRLRRLLCEYAPDVIHTLHFSGDYFGRLASIKLGIPVVTHIHNIKHERKLKRRIANRLLSKATDLYLSVSLAVASVVESDHNLFHRPSEVLYNAIDPEKLGNPAHDIPALHGVHGKIILGVGRYVAQKNFDLLAHALRLLLDAGHDTSLVLVGEGAERPKLEALRDQLGLQDRMVLTGYRTDISAYLRGAHVLAMPSDFEGLPITHLEAMFCELPAVVSRFVPSLEIAAEASLICETEPKSIAEKIAELLNSRTLHQSLAKKGRELIQEYTMEKYTNRLFEKYSKIRQSQKIRQN